MSPDVPPIGFAIQLLDTVHTVSGMPWWATIAVTTIALRTVVTLPLYILSRHNEAKIQNVNANLDERAKQLAMEIRMAAKMKQYQHWDEKEQARQFKINMKKHIAKEYEKYNIHPAKSAVVGIVQIPLWISMSFALRNMSGTMHVAGIELPVMYPDVAHQGVLWFPNLLLPDTLLLPLIMSVSFLLIIEMYRLKKEDPSKSQKIISYALRGVALLMFPIAASVPSCLSLYWTCSSLYGLIQNIVFRVPNVKRAFRIPQVPNESQQPFRYMWDIAKEKYSIRKILKKNRKEGK